MSLILCYEILLYLNVFYFILFSIGELAVGLFKIRNLPFPTLTLISEYLLLAFSCFVEGFRIFMARNGNLAEKSTSILFSMALSIPSIFGTLYFLLWQTYVLKLEIILCSIQLALQGLELALGILNLCRLLKAKSY